MPEKIFSSRYAFAAAAIMSRVPAKALRNWMDRKQIVLEAEDGREGKSWRRFSAFDILRLAITKHLVDFGMPVELSWLTAMGVFQRRAAINFHKGELSPDEVANRLRDRAIFAWRDDGDWKMKYSSETPSWANPSPAVLRVDVARVAQELLEDLAEIDKRIEPEILAELDDVGEDDE